MEVKVEDDSGVAFYDDAMILLTQLVFLREVDAEDVFRRPFISMLKKIGDAKKAYSYSDTSLFHSRGVLYYTLANSIPYKYDVIQGRIRRTWG